MSKVFTWILMFGNSIMCKTYVATINQNTWLSTNPIIHTKITLDEENKEHVGLIKRLTDGFYASWYLEIPVRALQRSARVTCMIVIATVYINTFT
jgi:hypothetical protein